MHKKIREAVTLQQAINMYMCLHNTVIQMRCGCGRGSAGGRAHMEMGSRHPACFVSG